MTRLLPSLTQISSTAAALLRPAIHHLPSQTIPLIISLDVLTLMGLLTILKKVSHCRLACCATLRFTQADHRVAQIKQKEKEVRLLILGLDNAGKTTIVRKITGQALDTVEPTLGFNIQTLDHLGYRLNLWDIGGQKSIRAYWRNYFESTDGIIWVVDSADRMRLEMCRDELQQLLIQERLAGASLLVLANKQDVNGALDVDAVADVLRLRTDHYAKRHWKIVACSAVTGEGLEAGLDWMVEDIASRIFMLA